MEYRGQIVIASIQGMIDDPYYKYKALIRTGNLKGEECYVAYRGNPSSITKEVIVRLEHPNSRRTDLDLSLDSLVSTANFVTSSIPDEFDFASSDSALLYGVWEERMQEERYDFPRIGKIANFFDVGLMIEILYYSYKDSSIIPYQKGRGGRLSDYFRGRQRHLQSPGSALRHYLRSFSKYPHAPRLVTIDEEIDLERRILPVFNEVINSTEFKISWLIKMEPQQ